MSNATKAHLHTAKATMLKIRCILSGFKALAEEVALYRQVILKSNDRDFLLKIRNNGFEFDTLIQMVEEKMEKIKTAMRSLP